MKATIFGIILFSISAGASSGSVLVDQFDGTYRVDTRWCSSGDIACENVATLTIGYDQTKSESYIIEHSKDNSTNTIWLFEGADGTKEGYITGTQPTDGNWTEQIANPGADKIKFRSLSLSRDASGAPIMYIYSEVGEDKVLKRRRFHLII